MANVFAIHSVGNTIATYLRDTYPRSIGDADMPDCAFDPVSSGELAGDVADTTRITLYLYRVTVNEHSRQARRRLLPLPIRRRSASTSTS